MSVSHGYTLLRHDSLTIQEGGRGIDRAKSFDTKPTGMEESDNRERTPIDLVKDRSQWKEMKAIVCNPHSR